MRRFLRPLLTVTALSLILGGFTCVVMLAIISHYSPAPNMRASYYDNWALNMGKGYALWPQRDWTLKVGKTCYGLQNYPFGMRLVCGSFSVLLPFRLAIVIAVGLVFLLAVGAFWFLRWPRDREPNASEPVAHEIG